MRLQRCVGDDWLLSTSPITEKGCARLGMAKGRKPDSYPQGRPGFL
ncbi:hypothetical protein [[Mycobacterium] holstebronense]|uniref:Uncharacterized protein n=1 Tax=[Mycobacterium] holstebronense TaxID=3064288 RepID=A0ABM9M6P6_9MYCO|nr:hypothetical protein [Mycolicibacter sp. MU0102]CAJ1510859.1 hypothetical protein MU0102_004386 [Mycolicibacter sp. MU0102]